MRRSGFRVVLVGLAGWLVAASAALFDASDPDAAPFRIGGLQHLSAARPRLCGNASPTSPDLHDRISAHYHEAMGWICERIADARGEPELDFDWIGRRTAEFDRRSRLTRSTAEGMRQLGPR